MNYESTSAKLAEMADQIEWDKGRIDFLALCLREDSPGLWDVVVAADWLKMGERDSYAYVVNRLRKTLSDKEIASISSVVILDQGNKAVKHFLAKFAGKSGLIEDSFEAAGGAMVRRAYIVTAKRPTAERPPGGNSVEVLKSNPLASVSTVPASQVVVLGASDKVTPTTTTVAPSGKAFIDHSSAALQTSAVATTKPVHLSGK